MKRLFVHMCTHTYFITLDFSVTKTDTTNEREAPVPAGIHTHDTKASSTTSSSSRDVRSSSQSSSSTTAKRGGSNTKAKQSKPASVTPSASTSMASERESGVGRAAGDEMGGARSKHVSSDGGSKLSSDHGRGVSPAAESLPPKGVTNKGSRKWAKSGKDSSRNQNASSANPHPDSSATARETSTSASHRNNTPSPTSTAHHNSTQPAQPAPVLSKRNESLLKDVPAGRTSHQQQHQASTSTTSSSSSSRGKGNPSRSATSKSHRHHQHDERERESANEHQRIGKRGSSDSSRESDKEVWESASGSWTRRSGPRATGTTSSNERTSSLSPLPSTSGGHVTSRPNQKASLGSKLRGENAWNQDVAEGWADEEIDPSVFSECSTDDDKLRNKRKMKAAAAAAQSMVPMATRPLATTGTPTPTTTTTVSSAPSHSWQEVTKTTRCVQS